MKKNGQSRVDYVLLLLLLAILLALLGIVRAEIELAGEMLRQPARPAEVEQC